MNHNFYQYEASLVMKFPFQFLFWEHPHHAFRMAAWYSEANGHGLSKGDQTDPKSNANVTDYYLDSCLQI